MATPQPPQAAPASELTAVLVEAKEALINELYHRQVVQRPIQRQPVYR
jgi:hypothetical protein